MGNLCDSIMKQYLDMCQFAAIGLVLNIPFLDSFSVMPHILHYLVSRDKTEDAVNSVQFYDRNADVINELDALRQFMQINQTPTFRTILSAINTPVNRQISLMINVIFAR